MRVVLIISALLVMGCSSLNNRTLLAGATSFVVCSLVGANSAPEDENKNMHGAMYGGLCSTAAMAISEVLEDRDKDKQISKVKEIDIKAETLDLDVRKQILKSKSIKSLDKSVQESLKGNWDVYQKTEWIFDGEKLKHENMEIEFKD